MRCSRAARAVLDAGCGFGRVGGHLASVGHTVVGVDVDPTLIDAARADHPGPTWLVGDLSTLDLEAHGIPEPFDAIVCAGNVLPFAAPATRGESCAASPEHLAPGRARDRRFRHRPRVCRGRPSARTPTGAGLRRADLLLATWDLRPYAADSDFIVAILRREARRPSV
jgi:SAM-dependent methyltransferase